MADRQVVDETSKAETSKAETGKVETNEVETSKDETSEAETGKDEADNAEVNNAEVSKDELGKDKTSKKKFVLNPKKRPVAEKASPSGEEQRKGASVAHERSSKKKPRSAIIREPAVIRRLEQASMIDKITSNGTISAAVMVVAALMAVAAANSHAYEVVAKFFEALLVVQAGPIITTATVEVFINDFLMAIFFMLVGIELKYEMTVGQLRRPRQALLPMLAAVGGVAAPALIYLFFNSVAGGELKGWAVPIATDIAFALGVMSLLGDKIEPETKVFFQTLAIADDILAILVLALFYGQTPIIPWCAAAIVAIVVLWGLNQAKVYSLKPYMIVGIALWLFMYRSGIHATLAGVILAFFLPARSDVRLSSLRDWLGRQSRVLDDRYDDQSHVLGQHDFTEAAYRVERVMHHVTPPLERAERNIAVLVNFFILPLFAFANAQVRFVGADLGAVVGNPVTQGVFFGAVLGKPIGIVIVTFLLVKIKFCRLPKHVTWDQVIAVGIMGGLGFTMSILISGLAYSDPFDVMSAKVAILLASFTSALLGVLFVQVYSAFKRGAFKFPAEDEEEDDEGEKNDANGAS